MKVVEQTETAEQREARILLWRTRKALEEAPDIVAHVRATALSGVSERGETWATLSTPLRITAEEASSDVYVRLVGWVMSFAKDLNIAPPVQAVVAARNFQDSHASEGFADATVIGFKAGTTPEGAASLVRLLTVWLLIHEAEIARHPSAYLYRPDVVEFVGDLRSSFPMEPRPQRKVRPRQCAACGEFAVRAEWFSAETRDVRVACEVCGCELGTAAAARVLDEIDREER